MKPAELAAIIDRARRERRQRLDLNLGRLTTLPDSIGSLTYLTQLIISGEQLATLPESIGNLTNLTYLVIKDNQLNTLLVSISKLTNLTKLSLENSKINTLSEDIGSLVNLTHLDLSDNKLVDLPTSIGSLTRLTYLGFRRNELSILPDLLFKLNNLTHLDLRNNHLAELPKEIGSLTNLALLELDNNPLTDLSILQQLPNLITVRYLFVDLPRRYWTDFKQWESRWLLDEVNSTIRQILIERLGYEKVCQDLNAFTVDSWREYTLLKIDGIETTYDREWNAIAEPMMLLKMICPSTQHIHILRVPPSMTSAEDAIVWVNHGIHPDLFAVQT